MYLDETKALKEIFNTIQNIEDGQYEAVCVGRQILGNLMSGISKEDFDRLPEYMKKKLTEEKKDYTKYEMPSEKNLQ